MSYHITLDCSDRYLVLPSCDVSEASSSEALLQLPQTAALLLLLLQGHTIHALLASADTQQTRDINARLKRNEEIFLMKNKSDGKQGDN